MPLLDTVLGGILKPVTDIIDKVVDRRVVDVNAANEIKLEMNKLEAQNASVFVSGWRPFIGWVCGMALAYQYVLAPVSIYGVSLFGITIPPPPTLDNSLWELVLGMLGMGAMRTFEKMQGV